MPDIRQLGPIVFPFTGYGTGGSHISTFLLAKSLTSDFSIPTVVLAVKGSNVAAEATARGLRVLEVAEPPAAKRETLRDVVRFGARRRLLATFGPNAVVHVCDLWSAQSWGIPAKSLGRPLVYHQRDFITPRLRDRLLVKLADEIVSISEACSRNLPPDLLRTKVHEIVNPFDSIPVPTRDGGARGEFEARWPVDGLKLVGFSANLLKRKRARYFIEAAAVVARHEPAARFVVFGRDRDEKTAELKALAERLGIGAEVVFAGFRSPPERNIAALDVLAVPALAEPFGRTLVEALLLGVPYVATDDAGHGEIARRWGGGATVPVDAAPEVFAAAIGHALRHASDLALDEAGRARVAEELRPATHARRVIDVYRKLPD